MKNQLASKIRAAFQSRTSHSRTSAYRRGLYAMLLPYALFSFILVVLPVLTSLGLSFFSYDAISPPIRNGLRNFVDVLSDPLLGTAIFNSLFFIVLAVPLRLLGALLLALLLNHPRTGTGLFRAAVYIPTVIPDVAYALIALWIFNPLYGPLNQFLKLLHLPAPAWLTDPTTAKLAIVLMSLLQIGEGFVLLLAGLKDIPKDYYDAAAVDGCGRRLAFRHITLPFLQPWLVLLAFRDVILSFQNTFVPAYIMTGGGPYYGTFFLPMMIYEEAFDRFRFGTGSVLMLFMFLLTLGLLLLLYRLFKGWGHDEA